MVQEECSYKPESEVIFKEGMMKAIKFLNLFIGVCAIVAMLVSCTAYKRPGFTFPFLSTQAPQIKTTMVEVTGIEGGKLKVHFDPDTGKCSSIEVNDVSKSCDDPKFAIPPENFYLCIASSEKDQHDKHPANTAVYGKIRAYCGNVKFLSDGADFRFKADSTAGNMECKNVGGWPICF